MCVIVGGCGVSRSGGFLRMRAERHERGRASVV